MNKEEYVIYTYTKQIAPFEFTKLFAKYKGQVKAFMKNKKEMYFGVDELQRFTAKGENKFNSIKQQLEAYKIDIQIIEGDFAPKYFGGFAFDKQADEKIWKAFPEALFIIFKLQYSKIGKKYYLTQTNVFPKTYSSTRAKAKFALIANHVIFSLSKYDYTKTQCHSNKQIKKVDYTTKEEWKARVKQALQYITTGQLEKIVLARTIEMQANRFNAECVVQYLLQKHGEAYIMYFEPEVEQIFIVATPELLVALKQQTFQTMALAGSISRGKTEQEDYQNAEKLLSQKKELKEHQIVVNAIQEELSSIATVEHKNEPQLRTLSYIHHLYTPFQGKTTASIFTLLARLHPTPALGGMPKKVALKYIKAIEKQGRGWYGAPIGWVDSTGTGFFVVAIRSARINPKSAWLFAGAGITKDSVPQQEWEETQTKFFLASIIKEALE